MRRLSDIVCNQDPVTLPATATVLEAAQAMRARRTGSVLVVDESGRLVGIFTGRDAVYRVLAEGKAPSKVHLNAVMTPAPITMGPNKTALDALRLMWDGGFRHIPVIDHGEIRGVVTRGDCKGDEQERLDEERELWEHMR